MYGYNVRWVCFKQPRSITPCLPAFSNRLIASGWYFASSSRCSSCSGCCNFAASKSWFLMVDSRFATSFFTSSNFFSSSAHRTRSKLSLSNATRFFASLTWWISWAQADSSRSKPSFFATSNSACSASTCTKKKNLKKAETQPPTRDCN